jgi:CII-binding regulator of phage lambda lysogenization HflD
MSKLRYHAAWFTRMAVSAWRYVSIFENIYVDYISFFQKKIWDALTGDVLHSFEHKNIVRACAFSKVVLPPYYSIMHVSLS